MSLGLPLYRRMSENESGSGGVGVGSRVQVRVKYYRRERCCVVRLFGRRARRFYYYGQG